MEGEGGGGSGFRGTVRDRKLGCKGARSSLFMLLTCRGPSSVLGVQVVQVTSSHYINNSQPVLRFLGLARCACHIIHALLKLLLPIMQLKAFKRHLLGFVKDEQHTIVQRVDLVAQAPPNSATSAATVLHHSPTG